MTGSTSTGSAAGTAASKLDDSLDLAGTKCWREPKFYRETKFWREASSSANQTNRREKSMIDGTQLMARERYFAVAIDNKCPRIVGSF